MKFYKNSFLILSSLFLSLSFTTPVFAQTNPNCPSVYGAACPSGQLSIEKKVQNPKTGEFVIALSSTDVTFVPDQEVNFRIEVKNTGSADLYNVAVQDRLPANVDFVSGPVGTPDSNNVINWNIDKLGKGESKFFQVKLKVKSLDQLHFDIACMTNFVQTQKDNMIAQNASVFCIQARPLNVPPITQTPQTGLPIAVWLASGLLGGAGFKLRNFRKTQKDMEDAGSFILETREFKKEGGDV